MVLYHTIEIDELPVDVVEYLYLAGVGRIKNNAAPPENNST